MFSVPTSGTSYELISKVYDEYGWDKSNILFVDGVSNLDTLRAISLAKEMKECQAVDPESCQYHGGKRVKPEVVQERLAKEYREILGKIDSKESKKKLRKLMDKVRDMAKFDFVVSNPPYQDDSIADNQAPPIYNLFFDQGLSIGHNLSFIFKDNWARAINDSKNKLHQWRESIFGSHRIKSVEFVGSVFPSASVTTSIVNADSSSNKEYLINGEKVSYPENYGDPVLSPFELHIQNKIKNISPVELSKRIVDYRSFALSRQVLRDAKKVNEGDIQVLTFVGNKREWTKASSNVVKPKYKDFLNNEFKVGFADLRPWQQSEKDWIYDLPKNSVPGEGFSCIEFNSADEVKNYKAYVKTNFWKYLCKMSKVNEEDRNGNLSFIPDLEDYTDNNPDINWKLPLDPQLYKLFNLTEEEIKVIEES